MSNRGILYGGAAEEEQLMTVYNDEIKQPEVAVNANTGILQPIISTVPAVTPNLSVYGIYISPEKLAEQKASAAQQDILQTVKTPIENIVSISEAINNQKEVVVNDNNNISAVNAASVMANHLINLANNLYTEALNNPTVPELQVQAKLAETLVADAIVVANETAAIVQTKIQNDKENVVLTYEKIAEENPTIENNTNLNIAKEQYNEVLKDSKEVMIAVNESKQVAAEINAKIESDIATNKIEGTVKKSKVLKVSLFEQLVNYIYKTIYKN